MEVSTHSPLSGLIQPEAYQQRTAHIFPSVESLHWYIRQHRDELARSRALIAISRRRWIDPSRFDAAVLEIAALNAAS